MEVDGDVDHTVDYTLFNQRQSMKPPSYLTKEFIERSLQENCPGLKIRCMKFVYAQDDGVSYIAYRINLILTDSQTFIWVKCIPDSRPKLVNDNVGNKREMTFYSNILNKLYKPFIPKLGLLEFNTNECYYTLRDDTKDVIVLSDLLLEGYTIAKRKQGLDFDRAKYAIFELAKFHAYSIKLRIDNIDEFNKEILNNEIFQEPFYTARNKGLYEKHVSFMMTCICNIIKDRLPVKYHSIGDIIKKAGPYIFEWMSDLLEIKNDRVLVLNHGQYWFNSILHIYDPDDSAKPTKCAFSEFQYLKCASPAWDLLYFFITSTIKPIRDLHMDEFLEIYFLIVVHTLESLNIKKEQIPKNYFYENINELKQELRDHSLIAFITATKVLPTTVAESQHEVLYAGHFLDLIKSQIYVNRLKDFINEYEDKGFFQMLLSKIPPTNI